MPQTELAFFPILPILTSCSIATTNYPPRNTQTDTSARKMSDFEKAVDFLRLFFQKIRVSPPILSPDFRSTVSLPNRIFKTRIAKFTTYGGGVAVIEPPRRLSSGNLTGSGVEPFTQVYIRKNKIFKLFLPFAKDLQILPPFKYHDFSTEMRKLL
jgi:hypothetical protein